MGTSKNKEKSAPDKVYTIEVSKNPKKKTNKSNKNTKKYVPVDKTNKDLPVVNNENTELTVSKKLNDYENNKHRHSFFIVSIITLFLFVIILLGFSLFTIYNTTNQTIANGVFIKGVNVSGLSKESAKKYIETFINEHSSEEIILKHNDFESSISLEQIDAKFDIDSAIEQAYNINRTGNMLTNSLSSLKIALFHVDIDPTFSCNEEQLKKNLEDITPNLPDVIIESDYYIDGSTLIATKGRTGNVVDVEQMKEFIKKQISDLNYRDKKLTLITIEKEPKPLDIDTIYNEIHKEPKDAYFTQDPLAFYPSETGMDFAISLEEAKAQLDSSEGEECEIPLKILEPAVTTNMIGNEAFPNQLSEFSTNYVNNANRTTNLRLAANKINGTVLMPGEVFSYNKVVGERTIAEGYKDAAIYVDGQTVDGLGGGICQVTSTLYEAALYANLEIVERSNHMFVTSYLKAGLDATVVYGSLDFQFKNNRNYPIKINCSVQNGVCYFEIRGLATPDDYKVTISSTSSTTATSINSVTYKTLSKDGQVVSSEVISRDTYKRH